MTHERFWYRVVIGLSVYLFCIYLYACCEGFKVSDKTIGVPGKQGIVE